MELKEFKITVLPLRAKLMSYARKLTDEPEDAEDAVQEVQVAPKDPGRYCSSYGTKGLNWSNTGASKHLP